MRAFLSLIVLLMGMVPIPTLACAEDGKTLSPYFFVEGDKPGVESFPRKSTNVVANISGVIADVTVIQIYE